MAAGLTDHLWSIAELLTYKVEPSPFWIRQQYLSGGVPPGALPWHGSKRSSRRSEEVREISSRKGNNGRSIVCVSHRLIQPDWRGTHRLFSSQRLPSL